MADSNSLHSYACRICGITCSGPENYTQHLTGAKHCKNEHEHKLYADALKPAQPSYESLDYSCEVCQTVMSGPESFVDHMHGKPHAKMLKRQQLLKSFSSPSKPVEVEVTVTVKQENSKTVLHSEPKTLVLQQPAVSLDSYHLCTLCNVHLSGPESATLHYNGSKHLRKKKLNDTASSDTASGFTSLNESFSNLQF